ncbi:MAG: hypothetical protein A3G49_01145 [Candidatus Sungbacteria bacterium RIFCSPLOWO2_12_FULL_41_11]|uniref:Uncharacterized protein n=1 Tax=Candidatus Sungbacteria bacterium RIFCSPLOWO2_12_FULL_41_11 TaxID=1802286 RepID=A0A1G2LP71_9BACT|nr:MAG: hypothetical protein UV01_C0006G0057 [Parcubacteria group bacterium GW2011_GWA2_42_14]OHA13428.1 MAG: hypothetical protein A3G49_01145 [Candidatus Sungbacteria bacterium RIFCSPLOWO2_12_FULL_41_11]
MLIISHILGTLVFGKALSIETPELYVALLAGVGVDIDHVFVNRKWAQDIKDFLRERKITYGTKQHSWLQEIMFGTFAGIIIGFLISSFWLPVRWWIFPAFLLLHIALDSVMRYEHKPFVPFNKFKYWGWLYSGTKVELILSSVGLVVFYVFLF